jgi:hypothetical protein
MSVYEIATIAVAFAGTIIVPLVIAYRPQSIPFKLIRYYSQVKEPFESNTAIEVSHPDKTIEKCRVLYNGQALICDDSKLPHVTILAQGSALFRIPLNLEDEKAKITIKNGRHTLRKEKLKDIEKRGEIQVSVGRGFFY